MHIVGAIIAIGLLIIVHEGGHYLVARWCRMRVDRFSIGFGPPIFRWGKRGETDFVVSPIPFGGYVQIAGMNIVEEVDPSDERAYPNRPAWQRFATIFAGPGTNYLFAIFLAFILYSFAGMTTGTSWVRIAETSPDYDAHGKLMPDDRIVAVNGERFYQTYDGAYYSLGERVRDLAWANGGGPIALTVERGGEQVDVSVTPKAIELPEPTFPLKQLGRKYCEPCGTQYMLGVVMDARGYVERKDVGVGTALAGSIEYPIRQTQMILGGLYDAIKGMAEVELHGPVAITAVIKRQFEFGWIRVFEILMILNVYLGLFNLLPLPALDGGRLVFLGYEMATRRRANPKIEATVHMVGIMVLFLVLIVVTYKDIANLL